MAVFQSKTQAPKYTYKTAQEVIESGGTKKKVGSSNTQTVKVIDMTGKEKRILSGNVFLMYWISFREKLTGHIGWWVNGSYA